MKKNEKFKFLDIAPADAAFTAYGKGLNEAFANAALAVVAIMTDTSKVGTAEKVEIDASGYDLNSLLFDWLNTVLYVASTEIMLFSKFDVEIKGSDKDEFTLKAVCWGEKIDLKKHEIHAEVKAITYHKMEVKEENGKWKVQVVVDL